MHSLKLRGVLATWKEKENMASISFYFDGQVTDDELEDASVICSEIIAHCMNAVLEEHYFRLDKPAKLPKSNYWAYIKSKREDIVGSEIASRGIIIKVCYV